MYERTKGYTVKQPFNPNDFFNPTTLKDIEAKLSHLKEMDFKTVSLNEELTKINYEFTSSEYKDFMYSNIEEYLQFEVDTIV